MTTTCTRYASSDKNELVRNITKGVGGRPGSATLVHLDSSDSESRAAFSVRVCDVVWAAYKNSKMHIVSKTCHFVDTCNFVAGVCKFVSKHDKKC